MLPPPTIGAKTGPVCIKGPQVDGSWHYIQAGGPPIEVLDRDGAVIARIVHESEASPHD